MNYDPKLQQAAAQYGPQLQQMLNNLHGAARVHQDKIKELERNLSDLQQAMGAVAMGRTGDTDPRVIRIEDIPGRRVPYTLLLDIPIGVNTTSEQQSSVSITQDGPFVAVRRMATFQSLYMATTTDPDSGAVARFAGRSYGRYRPVHSAWDVMDSQHNAITDAGLWYMTQLLNFGTPVNTRLPSGALGLPSNMSSFRTMQFDGRVTVLNAGSTTPRQNISVPSSFWSTAINSPFTLGALDFFERGEVITVKVQPTHVNNPPVGNVDGSQVLPAVAGLGVAAGWPFVAGQFDAHEGVATPGASTIGALAPGELPTLLATDSVERLPDGILTIGWEGYRIMQPIGPVG